MPKVFITLTRHQHPTPSPPIFLPACQLLVSSQLAPHLRPIPHLLSADHRPTSFAICLSPRPPAYCQPHHSASAGVQYLAQTSPSACIALAGSDRVLGLKVATCQLEGTWGYLWVLPGTLSYTCGYMWVGLLEKERQGSTIYHLVPIGSNCSSASFTSAQKTRQWLIVGP